MAENEYVRIMNRVLKISNGKEDALDVEDVSHERPKKHSPESARESAPVRVGQERERRHWQVLVEHLVPDIEQHRVRAEEAKGRAGPEWPPETREQRGRMFEWIVHQHVEQSQCTSPDGPVEKRV